MGWASAGRPHLDLIYKGPAAREMGWREERWISPDVGDPGRKNDQQLESTGIQASLTGFLDGSGLQRNG